MNKFQQIFNIIITEEEKGTGHWLPISHTIIEKHGGSLEVESELDVGTTIIIVLPIWKYYHYTLNWNSNSPAFSLSPS